MDMAPGAFVRDNVRLKRRLGEGAMGSVWVADHLGLRTEVAVKFIHAELAKDAGVVNRFQVEASAAANIRSPHVVQTFDQGMMADGTPFIVMELLHGESLADRLEREGRLDPHATCEVVAQVSKALTKAHKAGIIHRDVKPENTFLVESDEGGIFAKVVDFGIAKQASLTGEAKLTMPGNLIGTPAYMSREQVATTEEVTFQADLWALAVMAYECLTGEIPFDGDTIGMICVAICKGVFVPPTQINPTLPPAVDAFFQRAFADTPMQRFSSATELALELANAVATGTGEMVAFEAAMVDTGRFRWGPPNAVDSARADAGLPPRSSALAMTEPLPQAQGSDPFAAQAAAVRRSHAAVATFSGSSASYPAFVPPKQGWPVGAVVSVVAVSVLAAVLVGVVLTRPATPTPAPAAPAPVVSVAPATTAAPEPAAPTASASAEAAPSASASASAKPAGKPVPLQRMPPRIPRRPSRDGADELGF